MLLLQRSALATAAAAGMQLTVCQIWMSHEQQQ
jgi:hypothetical protein